MLERAFVLGVDHTGASLDFRENLKFLEEEVMSCETDLLKEKMVLSTCNRFEIYGVMAESVDHHHAKRKLTDVLLKNLPHPLQIQERQALYYKNGTDMVRHGFRVASSLESMVLGEVQILGQMRQAYAQAKGAGQLSSFMERFCTSALKTGKRVRSETGLSRHKVSMASLAVSKACSVFGGTLSGKKVLLLGAGEMGVAAGRQLYAMDAVDIGVVSRGTARAEQLIKELHARPWPVRDLQKALLWADVVVCSTSDAGVVISTPLVAPVLEQRKGRELVFLDIAVPRDVARDVSSFENVQVYGIDELAELSKKGKAKRAHLAQKAEAIILEEMADFERWDEERKKLHMIKQMCAHFEEVREDVLSRYKSKEAELATRLLMNKLLHHPLLAVKGDKFNAHCMEHIVEDVFGLTCPRKEGVAEKETKTALQAPICKHHIQF